MKGKQDATEAIKGTDDHKKKMAEKDEEVKAAKAELDAKLTTIGNIVHDSVPVSNDEVSYLVHRSTWMGLLYNRLMICFNVCVIYKKQYSAGE